MYRGLYHLLIHYTKQCWSCLSYDKSTFNIHDVSGARKAVITDETLHSDLYT